MGSGAHFFSPLMSGKFLREQTHLIVNRQQPAQISHRILASCDRWHQTNTLKTSCHLPARTRPPDQENSDNFPLSLSGFFTPSPSGTSPSPRTQARQAPHRHHGQAHQAIQEAHALFRVPRLPPALPGPHYERRAPRHAQDRPRDADGKGALDQEPEAHDYAVLHCTYDPLCRWEGMC